MNALVARVLEAERLLAEGRMEQALAMAQRLLPKAPGDPGLNSLMASILLRMNKAEQALFYAQRARSAAPEAGDTHVNVALCLQALGKGAQATAVLREAVAAEPGLARARLALANALLDEHDAVGAVEHCAEGLKAGPHAQLAASYAGALLSLGEIDRCVEFSREALREYPDEAVIASGLALSMTYQYGALPEAIAQAHRAYGRIMDAQKPVTKFATRRASEPEKRLRVGIVSPDLRQHSVSFFVEPFFEHHDRKRVELYVYSSTRHPDGVTERLKRHAALWRETPNLTDFQLAHRIAEDRVDVLLDLAGHTLGNNLPALNLRPAPVQATYCGYPDTTGLSAVDYRFVDSFTDPRSAEVDARVTERLYRLDPCFLCYRPPKDAPQPRRDPEATGVMFGSFNAGRKINAGIVSLWARIVRETSGSRMLLKSFDFATRGAGERIAGLFEREGVERERLEILAATPTLAEHLALYSRVDVALDAAPYNGTTTTCEALWMGVPVVTLEGRTHAARVGVSLLQNVGAPELITRDEEHYVRTARTLALDTSALERYRATLREKMRASALCDAPGFASRLEIALREMWRQACVS